MNRSGLRQLMTTQQMKIQASCLAEYEQVGTPGYKAASNTNTKIKKNDEKAEMNGLLQHCGIHLLRVLFSIMTLLPVF